MDTTAKIYFSTAVVWKRGRIYACITQILQTVSCTIKNKSISSTIFNITYLYAIEIIQRVKIVISFEYISFVVIIPLSFIYNINAANVMDTFVFRMIFASNSRS